MSNPPKPATIFIRERGGGREEISDPSTWLWSKGFPQKDATSDIYIAQYIGRIFFIWSQLTFINILLYPFRFFWEKLIFQGEMDFDWPCFIFPSRRENFGFCLVPHIIFADYFLPPSSSSFTSPCSYVQERQIMTDEKMRCSTTDELTQKRVFWWIRKFEFLFWLPRSLVANQPRLHTCPITEPSTSHLDPCLLVEGEERGKEENPQFNPSVGICLYGKNGEVGSTRNFPFRRCGGKEITYFWNFEFPRTSFSPNMAGCKWRRIE